MGADRTARGSAARLTGQQAALKRERGPPLTVIQPGVVDAHPGPGRQLARRRDVARPEVRAAGRPPERHAPQHHPAGHEGHREERRVTGGELPAAGAAGDPLGGLGVQVTEQDRAAGVHRPETGRVPAEDEHPSSGSQRTATGPSPTGKNIARVAVQARPAATSASAAPASSRWPGPVISTSRTSCPVTACAGRPNSRAAAAGQEATRPRESRVNAARAARSGPSCHGRTGLLPPAIGDSTGISAPTLAASSPALAAACPGNGREPFRPRGSAAQAVIAPYREISCKHEMYRNTGGRTRRTGRTRDQALFDEGRRHMRERKREA